MQPLDSRNLNLEQARKQAKDLLRDLRTRNVGAAQRFRSAVPQLVATSDDAVFAAKLALHDAQRVVAFEHGFESWAALVSQAEQRHACSPDQVADFFEAVKAQDAERVRQALDAAPSLVSALMEDGNYMLDGDAFRRAVRDDPYPTSRETRTALHLVATGLFKEATTALLAIARLLLERGADVDAIGWDDNNGLCTPIVLATWEGGPEMMRVLLEHGADVTGGQGAAALTTAANHGRLDRYELLEAYGAPVTPWSLIQAGLGERVMHLVERAPGLLSARSDQGYTLLQAAAARADRMRGSVESGRQIIHSLVRRGATMDVYAAAAMDDVASLTALLDAEPDAVHARLPDGASPVCFAAMSGSHGALEALLDAGADPDAPWDSKTALHEAARLDDTIACRLLLEHGAKPADEAMIAAAWRNQDPECVRLLLEHGANANATDGFGAINWAAWATQTEAVRALLAHGADPDQRAPEWAGSRPLHFAASAGDPRAEQATATMTVLLDAGADVNRPDDNGRTPLDIAVRSRNRRTADLLREHGGRTSQELEEGRPADGIDVQSLDPAGAEGALVRAALAGDDAQVDAILDRFPDVRRDSPACALVLADPHATARLSAANVNTAVAPTGWPPLLTLRSSRYRTGDAPVAASRLDVAAKLLQLGADPNAGTREAETVRGYRTVLGAAVGRARSAPLVRMLLESGADAADGPTLYEGCAMWEALRLRDQDSLEALLAADPPQWHLCHALPESLHYGDAVLTRRLLEAGGDPNWTMGAWGFGGTCLHEAVVLDARRSVVEALLDHGAQVASRDRYGRTPLALAVCLNRDSLARSLRERGAQEGDVREVDRWVGACFAHDRERAERMLASGAVSLRPADHLWVCRAARGADTQAVALLLSGGADPCAVDDDGQTALHLAASAADVEACRSLLAGGADPEALNYAGQTALDCALRIEDRTARDALAALLGGAAPSAGTAPFDDPAFAARFERAADAVVNGDVDGLRALLNEHAELATARSPRPHRCTLLHYLAANGVEGERQKTPANAVEVIEVLIGAGSDPNASCYTYRGGPDETTAGLLAGSAPPRDAGLTLPMLAALARGGARLDEANSLLVRLFAALRAGGAGDAAAVVDPSSGVAGTALVESVMLGETAIMRTLLDAGVDVGSRRGDGATALHLAAFDGNPELVEELRARGADLSLRDNVFDGTPAGWAQAGGHENLGKRLAARAG